MRGKKGVPHTDPDDPPDLLGASLGNPTSLPGNLTRAGVVERYARSRGREAVARLEQGGWPAASTVSDVYGSWTAAYTDAFAEVTKPGGGPR